MISLNITDPLVSYVRYSTQGRRGIFEIFHARKAWEDMCPSCGPTIRPHDKRTLELLLHCRRQQLKAASRGGALKIDDNHEWVSTSIISANINKVQGYFHIIPSGDKRVYGDAHLWNLHKDNKIGPFKVVEDCTVMGPDMGQLHELLAKASMKELETAMEINEPPKEELDHAEAYRSSEQEEQAKDDASENGLSQEEEG
jgi:hypothetical protein